MAMELYLGIGLGVQMEGESAMAMVWDLEAVLEAPMASMMALVKELSMGQDSEMV